MFKGVLCNGICSFPQTGFQLVLQELLSCKRWTYLLKLACAVIGRGRSLKMVSSCPSLLGRSAKSRCLEKPPAPGSGQKKILKRDGYGTILISWVNACWWFYHGFSIKFKIIPFFTSYGELFRERSYVMALLELICSFWFMLYYYEIVISSSYF